MQEISTKKRDGTRTALFLFAKISGWIAIPVVGALLFGKWLDQRFFTNNLFFLLLTGFAFIVSLVGIVRESKKAMREIEKQSSQQQ